MVTNHLLTRMILQVMAYVNSSFESPTILWYNKCDYWLVVEPTRLKNMLVKLEIFPK